MDSNILCRLSSAFFWGALCYITEPFRLLGRVYERNQNVSHCQLLWRSLRPCAGQARQRSTERPTLSRRGMFVVNETSAVILWETCCILCVSWALRSGVDGVIKLTYVSQVYSIRARSLPHWYAGCCMRSSLGRKLLFSCIAPRTWNAQCYTAGLLCSICWDIMYLSIFCV